MGFGAVWRTLCDPLADAFLVVGFPVCIRCAVPEPGSGVVLHGLVDGPCFAGFGRCVAVFDLHPVGSRVACLVLEGEEQEDCGDFRKCRVAVLILIDLWTVDRRYLNDSNFVKQQPAEMYKETVADKVILQDTGSTFRVLNINNPWQETNTSYFHHSIGGYHAVKLRRYQELIDHRLDGELRGIIGALQKAQTAEDVMSALAACPTLNMLNTRYVIYNPEQQPLKNPYAFGNAWFVDKLDMVDNADAEIEALNTIDPLETAVVDKRFQKELEGFVPQKDSTATIVLEEYRPNRLTYKSKADKEQLAVFSEVYYQPGWKATVDGKEVPHFRADWILRGMRVPAGEHTIVFEFRPSGYVTAAYVSSYSSFLILLLLIAAIGWSGWKYWKKSKIDIVQKHHF